MVLIIIIVPRLFSADLYRLMRMLIRNVIPIVRWRISWNGYFGDLIADLLAICIILRKAGKAVCPLAVTAFLYFLAVYDCVAILYLYCDLARSDMVLIFIIVPCLLAADVYRFTYWSIDHIVKYKVIFRNNLLENTRIQCFITIYQLSSIFHSIAGIRMNIGLITIII